MDTFFTTAGMGPVQILMMVVPIVVIVALIAGTAAANLRRWHKNNTAPQQELKVRVAEKRTSVGGRDEEQVIAPGYACWYYATFAVENGEPLELELTEQQYGQLNESEEGILKVQGTRYLGFEKAGNAEPAQA